MRDQKRREEKRRGEEEEKEEEEEKKKIRGEERKSKNVLNLKLSMDYLDFLYGYMFWVVGYKKPNPIMNYCMEIITNPFVFLGFCYVMT